MVDTLPQGYTIVFLGDGMPPTRLMLLRRSPEKKFATNYYTGIGGKVEAGEAPLSGAIRELHEETAITDVNLLEFGRVVVKGDNPRVLCYFFGNVGVREVPQCTEGTLEWVAIDDLLSKRLIPNTHLLIERWRERGWDVAKPFTLFLTKDDQEDIDAPVLSLIVREGVEKVLPTSPDLPPVSRKRREYWKQMFIFGAYALVFWLLEFIYQYRVLIPGEWGGSLVSSFALAGATLFGFALFSSAIFRFFPKTAKLWRYRRYMGVSGFIFTFFHVLSAYKYLFDFDMKAMYYTFNPIENPIIFGSIAFPIFFVMAATSTDWAVERIGPKRWKSIHRFVYVAYAATIFHFITINPSALKSLPGYFLLAVTISALFGQLFWFVKTVAKQGWRRWGTWVGIGIIVITLAVTWLLVREGMM